MLKISRFTCENLESGCVTDERHPRFSFTMESDRDNNSLKEAVLSVNGWTCRTKEQIGLVYAGEPLEPFTTYRAEITAEDRYGETAASELTFETGRFAVPWDAKWISDPAFEFTAKKISPVPMTFRRKFTLEKDLRCAKIFATALGIYELTLNGKKVGDQYFAPGFTSYNKNLQYQTYDVTPLLEKENLLYADVAGGWAVGSYVFTRKNRVSADRQALLLEIRLEYADGTSEVIGTGPDWDVTEDGHYRMADIYDGETYNALVDPEKIPWRKAGIEKLRISPELKAAYGSPVRAHEILKPVSTNRIGEELICDFGQNFAGVVHLKLKGTAGQTIMVRHAEILNPDGTLNTMFLRTAKATATYICRDGEQEYSPRMTYMGFRYVSITGIPEEDIEVSAFALYSDVPQTGSFSCSDPMLNRLQENILWGARSNFVEIPTDCPQRDERLGWTGDIALFSPTACFNFDMSRFLEKWLKDVQAEQLPTGGIPNTVPAQGYGFPATMPTMAIDFWGDACILVPWAEYKARGDVKILRDFYPMMKKYVKACRFWAGLFSVGKRRYIWNTPSVLHFGDWVAPDVPKMSQWQGRSRWTATASLCNTSAVLSKIARILGHDEEAKEFLALSRKTAKAYRDVFTDGNGKLKEEFQTGYVLPLYFGMLKGEEKENAAKNLAALAGRADYCIGTGFPGTPYILFALADNGCLDAAYKMLLNQKCPSWLYEVKMGATTIWERWDGLDENGVCPIGNDGTDLMISYNHYASGAVGDFLYRRVAGIEAVSAGYRKFRVAPMPGGGLTGARGSVRTPYGTIASEWTHENEQFDITVQVPMGTVCELMLPDGSREKIHSGKHSRSIRLKQTAAVQR